MTSERSLENSEVRALINARKLIEKPENWGTGGVTQRKGDGTLCIKQALCQASGQDYWKADDLDLPGVRFLREATSKQSLINFNDCPGRTHAEVLSAFDKAIELASGGPAS